MAKKMRNAETDRFFALNAVWFPAEQRAATADVPLDVRFRGQAELAIFRSAWHDPRALFVGFKAGHNDAGHAHLDLGSFVLDADGVRWAQDLGPDDYNLPAYFGDKRWTYY
ncbi:MAG: heparinase II/III family protein, partial [Spirochaetota bacterium]